MRLLYSFPHPVGRPGIGMTAFHQVQGAIRQAIDVVLYCTSLERELEGDVRVVQTLSVGGRRIPHRAVGVKRAYRYHDRRVAKALRNLREKIDLVHSWPYASVETLTAACALGIPSVREVPNTHTEYAFEAVAREVASLGLDPIPGHSHTFVSEILEREEAEYRLADLLLVPSEFSRRTFLERGAPAAKLALHRYGFDPVCFDAGSHGGRASARGGLRALFVGGCEPRKGLHYALRAWVNSGAADRGRFVVCGEFVPGYREALAAWLDHPSVEVLGFVTDPGALMRESDLLVLPSIEEGSALVTYEAQASGCVLAVSDASGARCEHLRHGLVHAAGDVETLTQHLRMLDADRELLGRLRRATLQDRALLTWDRAAEELASVYEAVATAKRGSPERAATYSNG